MDPKQISQGTSYGWGVLANLLIGTVFITMQYMIFPHWLVSVAAGGIVFYFFAYGGIINVPEAHKAVPLLLGKRQEYMLFGEGYYWWWPEPIGDAIIVDTRLQNRMVVFRGLAKNGVEMLVEAEVPYAIVNPFNSLSVTHDVLTRGLDGLLADGMRWVVFNHDDKQLMDMGVGLRSAFEESIATPTNQKKLDDWGLVVGGALVRKIIPTDPALLRDYEKTKSEDRQRRAEEIEREHLIISVKKIASELRITEAEALKAFQRERAKISAREIIVSGGSGSVLETAAAIIAAGRRD